MSLLTLIGAAGKRTETFGLGRADDFEKKNS